jgi:hypothetical protein
MKTRAPIAGIAAGLIIALLPGHAWANPSTASGTCQGGVSYEGHDYPQTNGNTVTIYIDNAVVRTVTFSGSTSGNVPNPDKTKAHTWRAVWDRVNGTDGDRTQSGEFGSCEIPPTTTTTPVAPTTTLATTTTVAATTTMVIDDTPTWTEGTTIVAFVCDGVLIGDFCQSPTTSTLSSAGPPLPATGANHDVELAIAMMLVLVGYCLLRIRRARV